MTKLWWVLWVAAACGTVPHSGQPDAAARPDAAPAPDGEPDAMAPVLDRSCAEVKARLATNADGAHWIDPDLDGTAYKPFRVHCADMATPVPAEFLELVHTSAPADTPTANFSEYATGPVHASWLCDCGVVTTLYSKVRIDPVTLKLSSVPTFTVFAATTKLACLASKVGCPGPQLYGVAQSCIANHFAGGRANIDLRDIPFHVAGTDTSMFKRNEEFNPDWGYTSEGSAAIDDTRKLVAITGGGDCGGYGAAGGLVLAQD